MKEDVCSICSIVDSFPACCSEERSELKGKDLCSLDVSPLTCGYELWVVTERMRLRG